MFSVFFTVETKATPSESESSIMRAQRILGLLERVNARIQRERNTTVLIVLLRRHTRLFRAMQEAAA